MANTPDWLTVSSQSGSSGQTILTLTANRNTSLDYKYATVTAYSPKYNVSAKTYVTIESYAPMLNISPTQLGVPSSGGTYSLSITATCEWVITFPSLVSSYSTSAGTGNATVTFTVPSATTSSTVSANIVVSDVTGQVSRTCNVQQYGEPIVIRYNPLELTLPYYGGSDMFTVSSNCMYTIASGDGTWYTFSPGSGTTGETDFIVSAKTVNTGDTNWTGTILVVGPEGTAAVLNLTQLNQDQYKINYTADTSTIDYSGETRTITIDATDFINSSITVSIMDAPDVTYSYSASGLTRGIITLNVPQNPGEERNFTVVVRGRRAMSQNYSSAAIQYTQEALRLNFVTDLSNVKGTGETRTITILNDNINPNRTGLNLPSDFPERGSYSVEGNVITLIYPANPSSSSTRTWTIRVLAQTRDGVSLSGSYQITQDTNNTYYIPYTADTSTVAGTGETRTITIDTSNLVASSITVAAQGATGISTTYSNGVVTVTFPANSEAARNIIVTVNGQTQGGLPATASVSYTQSRDSVATAMTLNVADNITNTGKATVTYRPSDSRVNIVYSSSDTNIATIDQNGNIVVLTDGTVTITATDLVSSLSDSEVVSCYISEKGTPLTFNITKPGNIVWAATDSSYTKTIEYKKNDGNWTSITSSTGGTSIPVVVGDVLQFRGDNATYWSATGSNTFCGTTAYFEVEGNIMSLIDSENFATATTLASSYAFRSLFRSCTGLTSAGGLLLPATALTEGCYEYMFDNCRSLTSAPELPAMTLTNDCYDGMFAFCSGLTTAPALPATTLADFCYSSMFASCFSLTSVPAILPATTLAFGCYDDMFNSCYSLTSAPALPATTLADYCYSCMFQECTSLTTAPALPAKTLVESCYSSMFWGCTNLNYIECLATDISAEGCTDVWVSGVSPTGTFVKNPSMSSWTTGIDGIPVGWIVKDSSDLNAPLTFEITEPGSIVWKASDSSYTKTIEYRKNNGNWTSITSSTGGTSILVFAGDIVQFRGDNAAYAVNSNYNTFSGSTAKFKIKNNIMSLIDSQNFATATTLVSQYTFSHLFSGCTGLTSADKLLLPATALTYGCYQQMFYGCTNLIYAAALPATILADYCYDSMFNGCSELISAPALPVTTLANGCYSNMFRNCSSLTLAPELPATTLTQSCYSSMFYGCTGLTSAPELPAKTLVESCYSSMFWGCTNLNYIKCLATNISATNCTTNWVSGVASAGTFVKYANMSSWTTGVNGIPVGWIVQVTGLDVPLTFVATKAGNIYWATSDNSFSKSISYKKNDGPWYQISASKLPYASGVAVVPGDVVQIKGNNKSYYLAFNKNCFFAVSNNCEFIAKGNIMSLIDSTNFATAATLESAHTFCRLFNNCSGLTDASELLLPATTLANNCYDYMFNGCTGLTSAPASLPAISLANSCYVGMFANCYSLTSAPELPATALTESCYDTMFANCFSLATPPVLPATTLASYCYSNMFGSCRSLISAPELPAETVASYCYYNMFNGCTGLTTAPATLPATTLASYCYWNMFSGCTSLTTAPELPATTLADCCYQYMFQDCTGLTTAPSTLPATTLANYCYRYMFNNCTSLITGPASIGTSASTMAPNACLSMFETCTSLTTAPALPATTLASSCYQRMFAGCTSLTTAPALPATTLASSCYNQMFISCTSLTSAPELPATALASGCYNGMFRECTSLTSAPELPATAMTSNCYHSMFAYCESLATAPALPATTLAERCYEFMFFECSGLTSAPELPAKTLASNCYCDMFRGCENLNYIKCLATNISASYCTSRWVGSVSSTGTFVKDASMSSWGTGIDGIPTNWTVVDNS